MNLNHSNKYITLLYFDDKEVNAIELANVDLYTNFAASYSNNVTSYPVENGYSINDNIYSKPRVINISFFTADTKYSKGDTKALSVFQELKNINENRKNIIVVTPFEIYGNKKSKFIITGIETELSSTVGRGLPLAITLKEIITVDTLYSSSDITLTNTSKQAKLKQTKISKGFTNADIKNNALMNNILNNPKSNSVCKLSWAS